MAKIMVADDSRLMRCIIRDEVEKEGHTVVAEASNGIEAVSAYEKLSPDIITMDITMDEMDGLVAIEEILKINPGAKIIVISALGQEELINNAIDLGVIDFIIKPFQSGSLLNALRKAL